MGGENVTRKLAAILYADVAGYSRLTGADEEGTHRTVVKYLDTMAAMISGHGGRVVHYAGDAVLAEFSSVVAAVKCAIEVQKGLAACNAAVPDDRKVQFRIGVNLGEVIVDRDDIYGDGVNVAARLESLADPGSICLSEDAYRQVRGKLELSVTDGGEQRLKNISRPVRIYRIDLSPRIPATSQRSLFGVPRGRRRSVLLIAAIAVIAAAITAGGLWLAVGRHAANQQQADARMTDKSTTRPTYPVIAVLPFANQTGDKSQEYVADGVTEELINALGRFNSLRVIGRNAILAYKVRQAMGAEIATELGASYVVEGSVRSANQRVRILAQLTDAIAGTVLWTDRYDGALSDVLAFQDTIARQIAGKLAVNIAQIEGQQSLARAKPNQGAYDLVLQARAIGYSATRSVNRRFRELTTKAIELDPKYSTAYALLAEALYARAILGWTGTPDADLAKAESLARQAMLLAPDEPDGHRALGRVLVVRGDYDLAQSELRRAIEINPSDTNALADWGSVLSFNGDLAKGTDALEQALQYNPMLEPSYVFDLLVGYYLSRRNKDAIRVAEWGKSRYPDFPMFDVPAAAASARLGQTERAAGYVVEIRRRLPFLNIETLGSRYKDPSYRTYLREGLRLAGY
jgi:adenylate cyclase